VYESLLFKIYKEKAKTTLDYIRDWFLVNGLTLNIDKTNIVKFSSNIIKMKHF
jgi:hypothetical protein